MVQVLPCIQPGPDDIVLPKTSSSVFVSTNIDYVLRALGVRGVLMAGCLTDQCVESAIRWVSGYKSVTRAGDWHIKTLPITTLRLSDVTGHRMYCTASACQDASSG